MTDGRTKPWGIGQAILAAKDVIHEPFLVINADDYYGKEGFKKLHDYMVEEMDENGDMMQMCMAGFILANTLSENGGVTRGICDVDQKGYLQHVSRNMFGLPVAFLDELERGSPEFLANVKEGDLKAEYLLPT